MSSLSNMFEREFPLGDVQMLLTPALIEYFENRVSEIEEKKHAVRQEYLYSHHSGNGIFELERRVDEMKMNLAKEMISTYDQYALRYAIPSEKDRFLIISPSLRLFMQNLKSKLEHWEQTKSQNPLWTDYKKWKREMLLREKHWENYKNLRSSMDMRANVIQQAAYRKNKIPNHLQKLSPDLISRISTLANSEDRQKMDNIVQAYSPSVPFHPYPL